MKKGANNNNNNDNFLVEPFQHFLKKVDRLFSEPPSKGLLQSINEFFAQANPFGNFIVNLSENSKEYIITAQLPGINKEQIHIDVTSLFVTITVQYESTLVTEDTIQHHYEKKEFFQKASRTIPLTKPVIYENATAKFEDGLLTIKIPKEKTKHIRFK